MPKSLAVLILSRLTSTSKKDPCGSLSTRVVFPGVSEDALTKRIHCAPHNLAPGSVMLDDVAQRFSFVTNMRLDP